MASCKYQAINDLRNINHVVDTVPSPDRLAMDKQFAREGPKREFSNELRIQTKML